MAARLGGTEVAHEIDDRRELIGLERKQPLIVAQPERADCVRSHLREGACHPAVLGEHLAALLRRQEIPAVRAHERVDADVLAWFLATVERRRVVLGELRLAVYTDGRPEG